jgi:hypothetical protein
VCCRAGSRPRACVSVLSGRIKTASLYECVVGPNQDRKFVQCVAGLDQDRGPFDCVVGLCQDLGPASAYPRPGTSSITTLLTYLLTPWRRVLLEKLTGLQLVKKFPALYGTRRFITALTSVRHLSLSWASPIQSTYPHFP